MNRFADTTSLETLLKRERTILLVAITGVTLLCWVYLVVAAVQMESMDMQSAMAMTRMKAWTALDFTLLVYMWIVMMVGMMLPSATPMILLYAQVARKAASEGRTLAPTGLFALGYLAIWSFFSVAVSGIQWELDRLALLSPMMVATSPALGAGLLIAAGVYQLTPWKDSCLKHCRAPAHFLSSHWRAGRAGAFRMGAEHGAFCLGCCWVLMALLFVGGVMNLIWIGAITLFVLLEKVAPWGRTGGRLSGLALLAAGVALLLGWFQL